MAEKPMTPPSRKRSREDTEQENPSKKARFDRDARVTTANPRTKSPTAIPAYDKANTTGYQTGETSEVQVGDPSSPGSTKNDEVKLPKQHRDAFVDSEPSKGGNIIPATTATKATSKEASDKVRLDPRRKTLKKLATPEELLELDTEEGIDRVAQKYLAAASKKRKLDNDDDDSSTRELGRATKKQRTANRSAAKILPRSKKARTPRSPSTISTASATSSGPSSAPIASAKPARKGLTTLQEAHQRVLAEQAEKAAEKETAEPEVSKNKVNDADNPGSRSGGVTSTQQKLKPETSASAPAPAPAAFQASGPPIKKQPYPPVKKKLDFLTKRVPLTAEQLEKADLKRTGKRLTRPSREPTAYSRRQAAERRKQVNEALMPESKRKQPLSSASGSSKQKPLLPAKTERKARQKSPASETDDESIENRPITSPERPASSRKESASSSRSQTSSTGAFKKPDSRLEALRRKYSASVSDDSLPSRRSS